MKIGIMGAMPEEIDSLRVHMTGLKTLVIGKREYHCGNIGEHEVILVFSRWGKVAAASTATTLINLFNIEQLIFTGVAGAVSPVLNIGDVVVSKQLYQHDMDARPLMPKHEIPLTGTTFLRANSELVEKAHAAATRFLETEIVLEALKNFTDSTPKCLQGTIATGDQFVSALEKTQEILQEQPEAMAVEMEGAAIAQVCDDYQISFVAIRTISDRADHSSVIDFPKFIKSVAGLYSKHIVLAILS